MSAKCEISLVLWAAPVETILSRLERVTHGADAEPEVTQVIRGHGDHDLWQTSSWRYNKLLLASDISRNEMELRIN